MPNDNDPIYANDLNDPIYDTVPPARFIYKFEDKYGIGTYSTVYDATFVIAKDYLNFVQRHAVASDDGFINSQLANELINGFTVYGDVDRGAVFSTDEAGRITGVTSDPTLLQAAIAKKLDYSNVWTSSEGSEETVETDEEGNKLKKRGNLFWREQSTTGHLKQLEVKDLEGRINQIDPDQWAYILEGATSTDNEFLKDIDPRMLRTRDQKKLSIFLKALGPDANIDYVNRHTRWFEGLAANPLVLILNHCKPEAIG